MSLMKSPDNITIAIDAMGGDFAPAEIVKGAVEGARTHNVQILLVGPEEIVSPELAKHDTSGLNITLRHADEVIEMGESPATAIRKKKKSSIVLTAKAVKQGDAQGMVAAGSTGAAMAAALLNIGRVPGVDRPAIGVVLPSTGKPCLLLDVGANADCIPEMLLQFARMGSVYMGSVFNIENPSVGIVNIGEELGKGNTLVNTAYELLKGSSLNFYGNIEGNDLFKGTTDVAVCDGFVGNVALKSAEGVSKMLLTHIKAELNSTVKAMAGAVLAKSALKRAKANVDPSEYGGALLLGINGICVIGHGSSDATAVVSAIRVAKEAIKKDVLGKMAGAIADLDTETTSDTPSSDTSPHYQSEQLAP